MNPPSFLNIISNWSFKEPAGVSKLAIIGLMQFYEACIYILFKESFSTFTYVIGKTFYFKFQFSAKNRTRFFVLKFKEWLCPKKAFYLNRFLIRKERIDRPFFQFKLVTSVRQIRTRDSSVSFLRAFLLNSSW